MPIYFYKLFLFIKRLSSMFKHYKSQVSLSKSLRLNVVVKEPTAFFLILTR